MSTKNENRLHLNTVLFSFWYSNSCTKIAQKFSINQTKVSSIWIVHCLVFKCMLTLLIFCLKSVQGWQGGLEQLCRNEDVPYPFTFHFKGQYSLSLQYEILEKLVTCILCSNLSDKLKFEICWIALTSILILQLWHNRSKTCGSNQIVFEKSNDEPTKVDRFSIVNATNALA